MQEKVIFFPELPAEKSGTSFLVINTAQMKGLALIYKVDNVGANFKTKWVMSMNRLRSLVIFCALFLLTILPTSLVYAAGFFDFFSGNAKKPEVHSVKISTKPKVMTQDEQRSAPAHVRVGVYVLHVGKYDPQKANIQMDFYLIFNCDTVCNAMNFEIMNATSSNIRLVEKGKNSLTYRVQAELNKADDLRNYPFDSHKIDIVIEDRQLTIDKMIYEPDSSASGFDSNLEVVGFKLIPYWTNNVINHFYGVFKRTFSSYQFSLDIARPWLAGVLKGILPALIISCCAFLALFMRITHTSQRLSIATSSLVATVVFHLNLTSSLPPLGYVTYADMFMLVNYLFLSIVLLEVVFTTYCIDTRHQTLAVRINTMFAWLLPLSWLLLQIIIWFIYSPTTLNFNPG